MESKTSKEKNFKSWMRSKSTDVTVPGELIVFALHLGFIIGVLSAKKY